MSVSKDEMQAAVMRAQTLERNLRDAEAAGRRLAKQAHQAEQERDALAAKLKELEGQEPVGYRHLHEDGWEYYDAPTGSGCSNCVPLYARPLSAMTVEQVLKQLNVMAEETFSKVKPAPEVPAEPVNARLVDAAKAALDALTCSGEADDPGHRCGHCDDYVDRNGVVRAALRDALASAEAQQAGFDAADARIRCACHLGRAARVRRPMRYGAGGYGRQPSGLG